MFEFMTIRELYEMVQSQNHMELVWQVNTTIQMPAWHGANVSVTEQADLPLI